MKTVVLNCDLCGRKFNRALWLDNQNKRKKLKKNLCGKICANKYSSLRWRKHGRGKYTTEYGYVRLYGGNFPSPYEDRKSWCLFEHVLIMAQKIGRKLDGGEVVHHLNGNRADNHPENLELMSRSKHISHHNREDYATGKSKRGFKKGVKPKNTKRDVLGRYCK